MPADSLVHRLREYTWMICENAWYIVENDFYDEMVAHWDTRARSYHGYVSPALSGQSHLRDTDLMTAWRREGAKSGLTAKEAWLINRRITAVDYLLRLIDIDYLHKKDSAVSSRYGFANKEARLTALFDLYEEVILWLWRVTSTSEVDSQREKIQEFDKMFPYQLYTLYQDMQANKARKKAFIETLHKHGKTFSLMYSNQIRLYLRPSAVGAGTHLTGDSVWRYIYSGADCWSRGFIDELSRSEGDQTLEEVGGAEYNEEVWHNVSAITASSTFANFTPDRGVSENSAAALERVANAYGANKDKAIAKILVLQESMLRDSDGENADFTDAMATIGPTYSDIVAAADAIVTNHFITRTPGDTGKGLVTHSNWASLAGLASSLASVGVLLNSRPSSNASRSEIGQWRDQAVGAGLDLTAASLQTAHYVTNLMGATGDMTQAASTAAGNALDVAGGSVNIVGGLYDLGMGTYYAWNLDSVRARMAAMQEKSPLFKEAMRSNPSAYHFKKVVYKMRRRKYRAGGRVATGALKGTGGVLAVIAGAGGVVSNPAGWFVAGGLLLSGIGLGVHSYVRGQRHRSQVQHFKDFSAYEGDVPSFCDTTGDYHRWKVATFVFSAVVGERNWWDGREAARQLGLDMAYVLVGGTDIAACRREVEAMGIPGLLAYMRG